MPLQASAGLAQRIQESIQESPATWVIGAINVAYFLLAQRSGDTRDPHVLIRWGATHRPAIYQGQYWRLLTAVFLHVGWVHLIWNTFMMYGWCAEVEAGLGLAKLVASYLATGIAASAVSVLCHDRVGAGASGAGFGMIGVVLMLMYRLKGTWAAFVADPQVKQVAWMIALWVVIGTFALRLDNYAHLGGLVFGLAAGWIMTRPSEAPDLPTIALYSGFALAVLATAAASVNPRLARGGRLG